MEQQQERRRALAEVLDVVAQAVAADGGSLTVGEHDYDNGVVYVSLSGACGTCSASSITLHQGIERVLRQRLDWVTAVVGTVVTDDETAVGVGGWTRG